jgi:hypothetical protein
MSISGGKRIYAISLGLAGEKDCRVERHQHTGQFPALQEDPETLMAQLISTLVFERILSSSAAEFDVVSLDPCVASFHATFWLSVPVVSS